MSAIYKRVVVKVSGEALGRRVTYPTNGNPAYVHVSMGFSQSAFEETALALLAIKNEGVDVAVVVGGGNIARGTELERLGMERVVADYLGMLATIQNGLALAAALGNQGVESRVMSALAVNPVCEPFVRARALRHIEKGRVVVFVAGTGNPLCTTDSAAALRAVEIGAEAVLAGKNGTRGVYDRDPNGPDGSQAEFLTELTYDEVIQRGLVVLDQGAIVTLRDHFIPTHVFNAGELDNYEKVVCGERVGSVIRTVAK
ncbi:MAG: UMP kinase [Candidatus Vogelbacteria bacterium CG10_big_fil_rev_8_21_14_0_10_51_16]|uniref:Uridylate kinase n=1 Tax=Candidatus Vogelbacteria bacterium CG10_big_fil_rev_8_21_14_0_10_51_16 TaxID=1975045 RepID=A0A2H0RER3_9BACT|nr:MAG: UMP kinase [Candidatus Vogelbacteria bacterium CG10_big_fil_rev_8_21_14_0_10_51_16]